MKIFRFPFYLIIIILLIVSCLNPKVKYPDELKSLHKNIFNYLLNEQSNPQQVEKLLTDLNTDGSWSDINYDDKVDGPWKTILHLKNLLDIAKSYQTRGNQLYHKKNVSSKIQLALNFWLENNFQSPYSWWYNEIGTPELLAPIMILMENELSEKQIDLGVIILNRSEIKYSGQNKVWVSANVLFRSLLLKDVEMIKKASESIHSELVVRLGDGIQPDWSYHQHGPQMQFGNYGLEYFGDMTKWIYILRNTPFAFNENKMEVLRNYLMEGLQWVSWKGKFDVTTCGRKLLKNSASEKTNRLYEDINKMVQLDPQYAEEYRKAMNYENLIGHKHFWRSEYQVKRTPGYFFSVKMVSERVKGGESSRYENVNGYYIGDGVTYLYQQGDEYDNIFPYWNWKKLPGTTIHQDDKILPLLLAKGYFINSDFVGGISDGDNGIAVMDYKRDGLMAKKSWFVLNDMIICLGAGICSSEGLPVTTSVNQSYYRDSAMIKTSMGLNLAGEVEEITDPKWILHDRIGYFFPDKATLALETKMVNGSWHRVATHYPEDEIISARIFNLWFKHGKNPFNKSYSYILIPNALTAQLVKMEYEPVFSIKNTKELQEVATIEGDLAGVVFYEPGESSVFGGFKVNQACIVMLRNKNYEIHVSVADPTQKLNEVQLTFKRKFEGVNATEINGKTIVKISLPQRGEAGKTEIISLRKI